MTSDKAGAAILSELFVKRGLENIIISPGSRNAPLVVSFAGNPAVNAISIVDERSAAYFALGIAQQTKKAVAITCTSGGAVLNYAPAIAEAYYQKVPLLVITADRPANMVDQGDGQTIRQQNVYANYIKASFEIPGEISDEETFNDVVKTIHKAIDLTEFPDYGPVHINIPFEEPIYNQVEAKYNTLELTEPTFQLPFPDNDSMADFVSRWNGSSRKLIIAGLMDPNPDLLKILKKITDDPSVVLLTETTSNLMNGCSCPCVDKVIHTISEDEAEFFQPDILISFGGHVVSKMVKAFLRKNKAREHWHIDPADAEMNTYQSLTHPIRSTPLDFLHHLADHTAPVPGDYSLLWDRRDNRSEQRHMEFLAEAPFSDLKVFETLLEHIPEFSNIQLGNSTAVRYAQLFKQEKQQSYHSNRGTSGIDGAVSTAAGAAYINQIPTTIITGDLGFLYDSNALMNHHLTGNLRMIIINNGGGGIFRFIPGPDSTDYLDQFFEASHSWNARFIARNFDIPYYESRDESSLKSGLTDFYEEQENNRPAILEIFTPPDTNAQILKSYFNKLKE